MAINLKYILDGSAGQSELSQILFQARSQIYADVKAKSSKANLGALEGRLHRIFYGGTTAISVDYYSSRISSSTEQQLIEIFNNFDFELNKTGHHKATTAISPNTLKRSMDSAKSALDIALKKLENLDSITSKEKIENIQQQIETLLAQGANILENGERGMQIGQERIIGKSFEDAIPIVNQLMAFSKALSIPDFVSPQEAGILFEEALALTNFVDDSSQAVITKELKSLATSLTQFGSESIKRGDGNLISYSVTSSLFNDEKEAKARNFKIQKGNATFTYSYNPSAARQGKMDVQLYYDSGNKEDYRVSAKRWSRGFGDLGETSIDAGITRAAGQSIAEAYKFAVLTPWIDWLDKTVPSYMAVQNAHDFATLALKSDIAMGLKQGITESGAGYANVLIVDTGSAIKVRDLATLVISDSQKLSKYNPTEIQSSANSIYNSMFNLAHGRTQSYLGKMTSILNKMKVTMNLSFVKG